MGELDDAWWKVNLRAEVDRHWNVINISPGGYRLRWESLLPANVSIGQVIALRHMDNVSIDWRVGVVKWIKTDDGNFLEAGIIVVSPKSSLVAVCNSAKEKIANGIYLPNIKEINQRESVVVNGGVDLPAGSFVLLNRAEKRVNTTDAISSKYIKTHNFI